MPYALRLALVSALALAGCAIDHTIDLDGTVGLMNDGSSTFRDGSIIPPGSDGSVQPGHDASVPPPRPDSGGPIGFDAGGGPPGNVMCGTSTCATGEICCVNRGGGGISEMCTTPSGCMGAALSCTGPQDCSGGQVCCAQLGGGAPSAMCTSARCRNRLCHTQADCGGMGMCQMFGGLGICF
jgi:hypothetical protein